MFWYFAPDATANADHETIVHPTAGLLVKGSGNYVIGNVISHSHSDSIVVEGDGNVLMNNIADRDVIIRGSGNTIQGMVFTTPEARLRIIGNNQVIGVPEDRIIR